MYPDKETGSFRNVNLRKNSWKWPLTPAASKLMAYLALPLEVGGLANQNEIDNNKLAVPFVTEFALKILKLV